MKIHSESVLNHPRDRVYAAYRDRLPELAAYIPDVKRIDQVSRQDRDGVARIHNVWIADREIPKVMQVVVKPEMLQWDDHAEWIASSWSCRWTLKLKVFTESVTCGGVNTFAEEGTGRTRMVIGGDLDIDLANMRGVPRLLAPTLKPQIEKFIVSLITPNLERVNVALERFLNDQK